jgi:hypothetical protein
MAVNGEVALGLADAIVGAIKDVSKYIEQV